MEIQSYSFFEWLTIFSFALTVIAIIISVLTLSIVQKSFQLPFWLYRISLFICVKEFEVDVVNGLVAIPSESEADLKKRQAKLRRIFYVIHGVNKKLGLTSGNPDSIGNFAQFKPGAYVVGRIYKEKLIDDTRKYLDKDESDAIAKVLGSWNDDIQSGLSVELVYLIQCSIAVRFGVKLPNSYLRSCFDLTLSLVCKRWFKSDNDLTDLELLDFEDYLKRYIIDDGNSKDNFEIGISTIVLQKLFDNSIYLPYEVYMLFEKIVDRRKNG